MNEGKITFTKYGNEGKAIHTMDNVPTIKLGSTMSKEQGKRLVEETRDLADRLNNLNAFMATKNFYKLDRLNKDLLYEQQEYMNKLLRVFGLRLEVNGLKFYKDDE